MRAARVVCAFLDCLRDGLLTKSDAVVQVRLGDALCGTNKDMLQKRPPAPQQLADVVREKVPKNAFVKVMAMPENHPLNQCKQETRDYLDALTTNLPAHHQIPLLANCNCLPTTGPETRPTVVNRWPGP